MGDRRDRDRDRDRGPPERINSFFVVDTGFVEPDRNTCFEFQRTGRCTKGDACRFTHAAPPSAQGQGPHGCVPCFHLYPTQPLSLAVCLARRAGGGASAAAKPWLTAGAATLVRCVALLCGAARAARAPAADATATAAL